MLLPESMFTTGYEVEQDIMLQVEYLSVTLALPISFMTENNAALNVIKVVSSMEALLLVWLV